MPRALPAALLAAIALGLAAHAQDGAVGEPGVGVYESDDGAVRLVLDRSRSPVLARVRTFDEILALDVVADPDGDRRLVRDDGVVIAAIDADGAVRAPREDGGAFALLRRTGDSDSLWEVFEQPPQGDLESLRDTIPRVLRYAAGASITLRFDDSEGLPLSFSAADALDADDRAARRAALDALANAAAAATRINQRPYGMERMARSWRSVRVVRGAAPGASFDSGELTITVGPDGGPAARPSSYRIEKVLADAM